MSVEPHNHSGKTRLEAEVSFLLAHPDSGLTEQNRRILQLMAEPRFASGANQYDIGVGALDLDASFQPDVDTHVRVAVCRLRNSLDRFYETTCRVRPQRLTIPRRKYCLKLIDTGPFPGAAQDDAWETPGFGWTVSAGSISNHQELAFFVEKTFPSYLAQSPLIHDGAIRSEWISARTADVALDQIRDTSLRYLVEFEIGNETSVKVWKAADNSLVTGKHLRTAGRTLDSDAISKEATVFLIDPLTGVLTSLLSVDAPKSRLAVAKGFFRFMASQDRRLLTPARNMLAEIEGTRLDSPLTIALRADAARASYCFGTCPSAEPSTKYLDETELALETDPYQPYAWLARSYYDMFLNGTDLDSPSHPSLCDLDWSGSTRADLDLFLTLVGKRDLKKQNEGLPVAFFDVAARFLNHFAAGEYGEAAEAVSSRAKTERFWTSIFRCAVSVELGENAAATRAYRSLQSDTPSFEDFAGRAILKMIPDKSISERISFNVTSLF